MAKKKKVAKEPEVEEKPAKPQPMQIYKSGFIGVYDHGRKKPTGLFDRGNSKRFAAQAWWCPDTDDEDDAFEECRGSTEISVLTRLKRRASRLRPTAAVT